MMVLATAAEDRMPLQPRLAGQSKLNEWRLSSAIVGESAGPSQNKFLGGQERPPLQWLARSISQLGRLAAAARPFRCHSWLGAITQPLVQVCAAGASVVSVQSGLPLSASMLGSPSGKNSAA